MEIYKNTFLFNQIARKYSRINKRAKSMKKKIKVAFYSSLRNMSKMVEIIDLKMKKMPKKKKKLDYSCTAFLEKISIFRKNGTSD